MNEEQKIQCKPGDRCDCFPACTLRAAPPAHVSRAMLIAGAKLSNIAFNLVQRADTIINPHVLNSLNEARREWDAARADASAAPKEEPVKSAHPPITAEQLADALGCFWNAALGPAQSSGDSTVLQTVDAIAGGINAVRVRLDEIAKGARA